MPATRCMTSSRVPMLLGDEVEVDHAARVHDEVGSVQDAAPREPLRTGVVRQRVVRRTADGLGVERVDDLVGEEAADAGRHEHVGRDQVLARPARPTGAEVEREVALGGVDVGDREEGAFGRQAHGEPAADLAEPGDRDAAVRDIRVSR